MLRIFEIKLNALENKEMLPAKVQQKLHLPPGSVKSFSVAKESVDARQKPDIYFVYNLDIEFDDDEKAIKACRKFGVKYEIPKEDEFKEAIGKLKYNAIKRPLVAGFGPCGMFAALILAMIGAKPIVLEQGPEMKERIDAVEKLWNEGILNPNANCQFGEGGAGTFSDGKLTTGTKSSFQHFVLESFVRFGADPEIMYKQRPHIGTDVLRKLVVNVRKEIIRLGGEVRFNSKLSDIHFENGKIVSVKVENLKEGKTENIAADDLILAIGHSSRDTVRTLYDKGVYMSQKQFSMGIRIEHSQDMIDYSQYGALSEDIGLGPADYKLNVKTKEGRGVYSFCMCPGGVVVNASSEEGKLVCNGMSYFKRDSGKANSALLCDVYPGDFGSDHPLAGIYFQEEYEKKAFEAAGFKYFLPKENLESFKGSKSILKNALPDFVYRNILMAIPYFAGKIKGFDNINSMCYGIESRSSSAVKINRSEEGFAYVGSDKLLGLYPAGEGAGYAGGIMSSACDGIKTALRIVNRYTV